MNERAVKCTYHGVERLTHPDVCKWHVDQDDPECRQRGCITFKVLAGARGNGPDSLESKAK